MTPKKILATAILLLCGYSNTRGRRVAPTAVKLPTSQNESLVHQKAAEPTTAIVTISSVTPFTMLSTAREFSVLADRVLPVIRQRTTAVAPTNAIATIQGRLQRFSKPVPHAIIKKYTTPMARIWPIIESQCDSASRKRSFSQSPPTQLTATKASPTPNAVKPERPPITAPNVPPTIAPGTNPKTGSAVSPTTVPIIAPFAANSEVATRVAVPVTTALAYVPLVTHCATPPKLEVELSGPVIFP